MNGTDGRAERLIDRHGQATQRECPPSIYGAHRQSTRPWWRQPRRTRIQLEPQDNSQRDARSRKRYHVSGCLWGPRPQIGRRTLAQLVGGYPSHCRRAKPNGPTIQDEAPVHALERPRGAPSTDLSERLPRRGITYGHHDRDQTQSVGLLSQQSGQKQTQKSLRPPMPSSSS